MAWAIALPRSDDLQLRWSGRWSLTSRILALNIFAIALLAGSFFWIDSFRVRLLDERLNQTLTEATIVATAFAGRPPGERASLAVTIGRRIGKRIRIYDAAGNLMLDSFAEGPPGYVLRDPHAEPFRKDIARFLDRSIETVVGATPIPDHVEPAVDRVSAWPEAVAVREGSEGATRLTNAPDRTPIVSAAVPFGEGGVLLVTENAR
ncbi:MAG: sensor N-terminal transmembrane domain-containing protein, partial [Sphingomonadaceae bacterium]|nr:sensor N-terminal transmembrane domain-containing protein [Sphingomonadaceae bacterium]